MTIQRDLDRLLELFLDEGPDVLPDRVLEGVREDIYRMRRRATFGPWRTPIMNKLVTIGLAAAAVVATVLIGSQFFRSPTGGVGTTPTGSPEPSVAWRPLPPPDCTDLEAGTYRALIGTLSVSVTVPAGWRGGGDRGAFWVGGGPCFMGFGERLQVELVTHVYADACDRRDPALETGTPAAVVAALVAQTGHQTIGPIDTTVGGYPASRFEFSIPDDFDDTTCPGSAGIQLWQAAPGEGVVRGVEIHASDTVTVYVVDVGGSTLAVAAINPDAELESVVASLRIEP